MSDETTEQFNPRENDNVGTMACFHRRYTLGDKHSLSLEEAVSLEGSADVISLPLYLYDHSGITMSTSPFSCSWDSGKIGFIFCTKEKAKKEWGWKRLTMKRINQVIKCIHSEVEEYNNYIVG